MDTGIIVGAARRDARNLVGGSIALVVLLAAALAVNWQYLYNRVQGPFQSDASVAEAPGPREVKVKGATASSGVVQEASVGGHRSSPNLLVLIAAPLVPLSLIFLGYACWAAGTLERHTAFAALKHLGPPSDLAFRIERELIVAGRGARVGPFAITASWVVTIDPKLRLYPIDDLMGLGHEMIVKKSGATTVERHVLRVWVRGRPLYETIDVTEPDARGVLARIATRCPWAVVDDIAAFERRWRSDREECERVVDKGRRWYRRPRCSAPAEPLAPGRPAGARGVANERARPASHRRGGAHDRRLVVLVHRRPFTVARH